MKSLKKLIALALSLMMILVLTSACKKLPPELNGGEQKISTLEEEKGATLSIMIPGHDDTNPELWQNKVIEEFKKLYPDVTVEFVIASWDNWETKVLSAYKSNEPIDLINDGANNNPKFALKHITQPINPYVNMNNPNLHKTTMDEVFTYGGKTYVAVSETNVGVVFYNKDLFEREGVEDPGSLYAKGEWTWENFVRIAKEMTDESRKLYGAACDYPYLFFGSNATSACKLTAEGKYVLNIDDPAVTQSLEIWQDGRYDSRWSGYEGSPYNTFYSGSAGMLCDWQFTERSILSARQFGLANFEYGVVPMPTGPNNTDGRNPITAAGWAIGDGSDCPAHVGKLIDMLVDGQAAYLAEINKQLPKENQELYALLAQKPYCTNSYDSALGGAYEIFAAVAEGQSVSQAIEEYKPQYQATVNDANSSNITVE